MKETAKKSYKEHNLYIFRLGLIYLLNLSPWMEYNRAHWLVVEFHPHSSPTVLKLIMVIFITLKISARLTEYVADSLC